MADDFSQPQGELAISLRCRMMDAVLATRSHLYLEVIKPVMQQGSNLSKGGTVMDVQSSTCSAFPARGEVSYAPVDVVRLEQLEQHVAKLESTLHAAVAELEVFSNKDAYQARRMSGTKLLRVHFSDWSGLCQKTRGLLHLDASQG